jgi:hypothetical protein
MSLDATSNSRNWFQPIAAMLARPDYAFPVAAAQTQFRERFYGLNAAALLEDVFVDALENFTKKHQPGTSVIRPSRGEKAFDYTIEGTSISHKVGMGAIEIAVLWDATRTISSWSATHPIAYHLTDAKMRSRAVAVLHDDGSHTETDVRARALHDRIPKETARNAVRRALVTQWNSGDGVARVLAEYSVPPTATTLAKVVPFDALWQSTMNAIDAHDSPANAVDVILVRAPTAAKMPATPPGTHLQIDPGLRSGIYALPVSWMTDVSLIKNNRAQLIPRQTVALWLGEAMRMRRFTPLPTWIAPYLASRPPSLYLAQVQAFNGLF